MHREFKDLLVDAEGLSEFVIAVNLDIRGFSQFCKEVDSSEMVLYITTVYHKLINNYFNYATFFKSTGDGLFILINYNKDNFVEIAEKTLNSCLDAVNDFKTICEDDPIINFKVPCNIGIGISRGAASRIESNEKILDYSGRILNLASRLMDIARPSGVVIDSNFDINILPDEQKNLFKSDEVYLKGIAEREPVKIYYTEKLTSIPPSNKSPIDEIKWKTETKTFTSIQNIKNTVANQTFDFASTPIDPSKIKVKMIFTNANTSDYYWYEPLFRYYLEGDKPFIAIEHGELMNKIDLATNDLNVDDSWKLSYEIIYPEKWIPTNTCLSNG